MWREDLLMLPRGGELGNEVTGRFAGISVWLCLLLVSVSSRPNTCDMSEPHARHKTVLKGCLPSSKEWAAPPKLPWQADYSAPSTGSSAAFSPAISPFHWIQTAQWWCRWRFATQDSVLVEFSAGFLGISYSLSKSSKHFEEQKLEGVYEK